MTDDEDHTAEATASLPAGATAGAAAAPRGRPTLKTISQLSGLAVPTVSRALNDAPDIGAETKRRVREIAREIGYQPNRAGLRLRTGKTNVIALILSTDHDMMNHTARLISSIAAETRDTPYHMIVTPYFPDEDPMKPVRYVTETRSADGLIINQVQPRDPRVKYLMKMGFPFVTHGRSDWCADHPYFDFDNTAFGRICARRLAARGRKRLLMIAPPREQNYSQHMTGAAAREAHDQGVDFEVLETATSDAPNAVVEEAMRARLQAPGAPDGIICGSTNSAMSAIVAAESLGLTLGQDFDLAAKEAMPFLNRFRKDIIVVREDVSRAGAFLARALMQAIDRPGLPPLQELEVPVDPGC